jgi:hypothetical protein
VTLHGPDPDLFRTEVYGARWYVDPLPGDNLTPATDERWPSVTTIKKAWSKPFRKKLETGELVSLDAFWAAEFIVDHLDTVESLSDDRAAALALVAAAPARRLNSFANRGTGVHTVMEDLMAGKGVGFVEPAVEPFVAGCKAFVEDWAPVPVASEFVVVNRTIGFGGTGDAILTLQLNGGTWVVLVDYKSRGGEHGCYEEDVAQIGGYSLAEYMVVLGPDGRPMRMALPALDAGLVVSLTTEGYAAYPVDLDEAAEAFLRMRESWEGHREGQKAARRGRGNPLVLASSGSEGPPAPNDAAAPAATAPQEPATNGAEEPATPVEQAPTPWQPPIYNARQPCPACGVEPGVLHLGTCDPSVVPPQSPALVAARIGWLRGRVDAIKTVDGGRAVLARHWSEHPEVPTFPKGGPTTPAEVDVVSAICWAAEGELGLPFPADDDPAVAEFLDAATASGLV